MSLIERSSADSYSGFYYDSQILDTGLTMTLHPNTLYTENPPLYWTPVIYVGGEQYDEDGYRVEPIARAIIGEDFQLAAANDWMDSGIIDDLSGLFNQFRAFAPFADRVADQLSPRTKEAEDTVLGTSQVEAANKAMKGTNDLAKAVTSLARKGAQYANRALVVQGTRFSMYNGTNIAFSNMVMKYTLFSDWDSNGNFVSCIDKIKGNKEKGEHGILNYVVGKYVTLTSEEPTANSGPRAEGEENIWNQFLGWQIPPGGFKADLANIDNVQMGTLKVIFGGMYSIQNLVIQDAQFTFSKQMIKVPDSTLNSIDLAPMYCDVQLTLKPASKYTNNSILKAIDGSENRKQILKKQINDRLGLKNKFTETEMENLINKWKVGSAENNPEFVGPLPENQTPPTSNDYSFSSVL